MNTQTLNPNIVKTKLDGVLFGKYDEMGLPGYTDARDASVFNQETTDRASVELEEFAGTGYFDETGEGQDLNDSKFKTGRAKTVAVTKFTDKIGITSELADDDQWSVVNKATASLGLKARKTQDREALRRWVQGFTTTKYTVNDALPLFSNSHTTQSGATVNNLGTEVLSESALYTGILALQAQPEQDGTAAGHQPACLLVAPSNFKLAREILDSELKSGTGNNDLNYYSDEYPGMMLKTSLFLSTAYSGAASDPYWYLLSNNHTMMRYVRQPLTTAFTPWEYSSNDTAYYQAKFREVVEPISFEGVWASNGSA